MMTSGQFFDSHSLIPQATQQEASRGDGMLDFGAVNWAQLRKYDIFQQMLNAASSSPTAQASALIIDTLVNSTWHSTRSDLQLLIQHNCLVLNVTT